jgi:hypothetical protein
MIGQTNPQLIRIVEQTVTNLKQLESCIDALRVDLAGVAQSIGHPDAAARAITPIQALTAQSPFAAAQIGALGQLGQFSPFSQASPFANTASWASPYAAALSPLAANPWAAATLNPWASQANVSPYATQSIFSSVSPYASLSPYANQSLISSVSPYASLSPYAASSLVSPAAYSPAFQSSFARF